MHAKVYVRRGNAGWWYLDLFGWRPFKTFNHGGWVYLSVSFVRRHWRTVR